MSSKQTEERAQGLGRRAFLRGAGLGAAGAGAAAVLVAGETAAEARAPEAVREGAGYRKTDHVRRYYDLARGF